METAAKAVIPSTTALKFARAVQRFVAVVAKQKQIDKLHRTKKGRAWFAAQLTRHGWTCTPPAPTKAAARRKKGGR